MFSNKKKKTVLIGFLSVVFLVIADQITKLLAVMNLKGSASFPIISNVFELRYLENQSAAFGVDIFSVIQKIFRFSYFNDNPEAFLKFKMFGFTVLTILVIIILMLLFCKIPEIKKFKWLDLIIILFVAGAIGNLIDRMVNNYVVDFFYFILIDFPIFNVADIYVTVAAFLFIILGIFYYKETDYEMIFPPKKKKDN